MEIEREKVRGRDRLKVKIDRIKYRSRVRKKGGKR